ncbi:HSDL2 protein, partial [Prunella fulvescens]|nr:HSDL2 protein [Prunella fulvescens]
GPVAETFRAIQGAVTEEYVRSTQGVFQFELSGKPIACAALPGKRHGVFPDRSPLGAGPEADQLPCSSVYKLKPFMAFMLGNSSIKGGMMLTLSLEKML